MFKAIAIASVFSLSSWGVSADSERNVFAGPWAGNCGDDVQCTLEFDPAGSGYTLELRVSDAMDDAETVCVFEVEMQALAFDVLVSEDQSVRALRTKAGAVVINGLPNDECSGAAVNGEYVQFADM